MKRTLSQAEIDALLLAAAGKSDVDGRSASSPDAVATRYNFRRPDHSGWAKAGWALLILVIPLFGTLIYLIARPADASQPIAA